MRVLIAEDDEDLARFLRRLVERWGHESVCAADGAEAWRLLECDPDIALVVCDWMMPGVDGPELVRRLRDSPRPGYVYTILLTAKAGTEDVVRGMEAGADDFLSKPFDQNELRVRLRAGERVVRLERELARRNAELEAANRRMRRDLEAAALVQRSLLPSGSPGIPGAHFAWAFRPCEELAGDALGVVPLGERHAAVYVLDVSGHGVAAALLSVAVRHVLTPVSSSTSLLRRPVPGSPGWRVVPPAEVAEELNRRFAFDEGSGHFFTLLYGVLDLDRLEFRYASAGHPGPVYLPRRGEPVVLPARGLPIGLAEKAAYEERVRSLRPGDRLFLYSDGVWDAAGGDRRPFGPGQFLRELESGRHLQLQEGVDLLLARVQQWCEEAGLQDDAALLAIEICCGRE